MAWPSDYALGQRTVFLTLSEPRASQQAQWLQSHGFEVIRASMHALSPLDASYADWRWIEILDPENDVLVPVSPGAIGCLALGLDAAGLKSALVSMAWLCLGEGSLEALQSHFPEDLAHEASETSASFSQQKSLRRLAKLELRDLAHLLSDPDSEAWIGERRIHLLCARGRCKALRTAYAASLGKPIEVHAVYQDRWLRLGIRTLRQLSSAIAAAEPLCWQIGSLALLERWHQSLNQASTPPLHRAIEVLEQAALCAPHPRILDRARQLGYLGPANLVVGREALLAVLQTG